MRREDASKLTAPARDNPVIIRLPTGGSDVRAWLLGGAIAVVAATAVTAQQGRFKGRIDLVNVPVMVLDRQGNFISNLSATDFEVYENGQRQDLSVFVRGDAEREALKLRLGLLFDTSGSMFEDMGLACTAAIRFLKDLPEAEDITLVDFDTEVRVAQYGTVDMPRLVERIRSRKADGWTSLYDALGIYLDGAHDWKAGRFSSSTPMAATRAARRPSPTSWRC